MFKALLGKELRVHLYDFRYLVYAVLTVSVVLGSFTVMRSVYLVKHRNHSEMIRRLRTPRTTIEPGALAFTNKGIYYPVAPNKMQVFYQGVEREWNKFVNFSFSQRLPFMKKETMGVPVHEFFPTVDFTLVVIFILSLLVFIFTFNSVSREKESGTLKLMLANNVPRVLIILAKLVGGYIGVVIPLAFAFGLIILSTMFGGNFVFTSADLVTTGLVFVSACCYLLLMYLIGILVSVRSRRSATALSLLVLIWLVGIVALHNGTLLYIEKVHKPLTIGDALDKHNEQVDLAYKEVSEKSMKEYGLEHWLLWNWQQFDQSKVTPAQLNGLFYEYLEKVNGSVVQWLSSYINDIRHMDAILSRCSYFSPTLLFTQIISTLTDTGVKGRLQLFSYCKDYQNELLSFVKRDLDQRTEEKLYYKIGWVHRLEINKLAKFNYRARPVSQRIADCLGYLGIMLGLSVVVLYLAFLSFAKMEIE